MVEFRESEPSPEKKVRKQSYRIKNMSAEEITAEAHRLALMQANRARERLGKPLFETYEQLKESIKTE